jgi:hypothetical protein
MNDTTSTLGHAIFAGLKRTNTSMKFTMHCCIMISFGLFQIEDTAKGSPDTRML